MVSKSLQKSSAQGPETAAQGKTPGDNEKRLIGLCSCPLEEALASVGSDLKGIEAKEADKRLSDNGPNELSRSKRFSFWTDMFERVRSPLVVELLIIAALSAAIGQFSSAIIVGAMIALSVGLSYILDRRSNQEVEALGKRVQSRTYVIRGGAELEIKMSEAVIGDIVLLHAGSIVPADLRLISAKDFFIGESALTGESLPVEKTAATAPGGQASALELPNACFMGTTVMSGTARGLVVNTGMKTIFGSISAKLIEKREETSFDKGVRSFTWLMIRFMVVMVATVFLIVGATKGNWIEALLFALSVAVGLTPEMLPMIVTVNLAKGALAMAKKKVIVRRLPSIQNLGAINILCTDKTGTLTQDRVVLEHHVDIHHREQERGSAQLRLSQQLFPDGPQESSGQGRAGIRRSQCGRMPARGRTAL